MPKYKVEKVGAEVGKQYVDLVALNFSERSAELKRIAWDWCFAPLRPGEERTTFTAVLLADDEIVGAGLLLGVDMWIAGRTEPGWVILGTSVHPDHRGRGLMLVKSYYNNLFDRGVAIGMGNETSDILHVRFGADRSPRRITRFKLYRSKTPLTRRAEWLGGLSGVADAVLRAGQTVERVRGPRLRSDEQIVPLEAFDEDYEDFWLRARANYPMLLSRDADYMKWRYLDAPFENYGIDVLRDGSGIQGVVVTRVGIVNDRRVGQIVDLLPVRPDARGFGLLLAAADRRLSKTDAEYATISYVPRDELDLAARRAGFHSPRPGLVVSAKGFDPACAEDVTRLMGDVYFMRGDQDEDY
ncbi:hypothetical protein [Marivita sp. S2033]|uniref:hypothetical protein n=1 Tax=Marivita sp. S2033 TaxID=3373187 RepID=UPI003982479B